ncbi:MAG: hypothetical protein JNM31_00385 [Flavobacteriales bacterium]|nr:hypothetical protein [Flavobacteriales bacterium]
MRILLLTLWSLAALVVQLTGHTYILPYALVLGLFLVFLGRLPGYRQHPARYTFDLLFLTYLWAIVAVRCRPFRWSIPVELALNIAEHIGFALVIGLLAYLIFLLLFRWPARRSLIAALISFNVLGLGNEVFQDIVFGGSLQPFDTDAWKDIGMNAFGSVLLYFIINRSNDPITPAPTSGT